MVVKGGHLLEDGKRIQVTDTLAPLGSSALTNQVPPAEDTTQHPKAPSKGSTGKSTSEP
jgi:hypothetical protein